MAKVIKSSVNNSINIIEYKRDLLHESEGNCALEPEIVDPATLLAEARVEAERKVQEAYAEGLRRGEEAGRKAYEESVGQSADMLESMATQLQEQRDQFISECTNEVSELVRIVASKVLAIEVTTQPEVVELMVCRTLEKLIDQEQVTMRVNPRDFDRVMESRASLLERFERIQHMDLVQDDTIETGGCIAESDRLYIDAQLQSQLKLVVENMNKGSD